MDVWIIFLVDVFRIWMDCGISFTAAPGTAFFRLDVRVGLTKVDDKSRLTGSINNLQRTVCALESFHCQRSYDASNRPCDGWSPSAMHLLAKRFGHIGAGIRHHGERKNRCIMPSYPSCPLRQN